MHRADCSEKPSGLVIPGRGSGHAFQPGHPQAAFQSRRRHRVLPGACGGGADPSVRSRSTARPPTKSGALTLVAGRDHPPHP